MRLRTVWSWTRTILELPFLEAYCRARYHKSYLQKLNEDIDQMLEQIGEFFE